MLRPKLLIKKKKIFDDKGWNRYYGNVPFDLNESSIFTEKQLLGTIYQNFGEGRYMVLAFKKGRQGFWVFWIGDITKDGYTCDARKIKNSDEIDNLKDLKDDEDQEFNKVVEYEIAKEQWKNENKKFGFIPYLKPSGRRGSFNFWGDYE